MFVQNIFIWNISFSLGGEELFSVNLYENDAAPDPMHYSNASTLYYIEQYQETRAWIFMNCAEQYNKKQLINTKNSLVFSPFAHKCKIIWKSSKASLVTLTACIEMMCIVCIVMCIAFISRHGATHKMTVLCEAVTDGATFLFIQNDLIDR